MTGSLGHARLGTLVVDAFRVSQSMHRGAPLSASVSNSLGGADDDLVVSAPRGKYDPTVIFRKVPVKQYFGNPVCVNLHDDLLIGYFLILMVLICVMLDKT